MAKNTKKKEDKEKKLKEMPLVAVREMTIFPEMFLQFHLERKESVLAVEKSMMEDQRICIMNYRIKPEDPFAHKEEGNDAQDEIPPVEESDAGNGKPAIEDLCEVGVIARVLKILKTDKDLLRVQVEGLSRCTLKSLDCDSMPYFTAVPEEVNPKGTIEGAEGESLRRSVLDMYATFAESFGIRDANLGSQLKKCRDLGKICDRIAVNLPISEYHKQELLATLEVAARCEKLILRLQEELEVAKKRQEIRERIGRKMDQHQKEYVLREQLALIQSELDEEDEEVSEVEQFKKATEELCAPEEVKEKLRREIRHLAMGGYGNAEVSTIRSYIETLLELPWDKCAPEQEIDIENAREILDRDHYGLKDVKERVLEYLAVRALTGKGESPILCLVGPPGTGKTSIARSVAEATGKPYVRICLGGVRDEAEVRGHRKTYVGAMPGRITAGLRQAGVKDPLMLLDEIDKMGQEYRGDIASAMLEVLDSEQNKNFRDHYLELPMDLSKVLFIATANDESTIPRPLMDRMELIEIAGYTANEKFHIAREHLLNKVMERNGLTEKQLKISDGAIKRIIECYCREAGVRMLERELDKLCRKAAVEVLKEVSAGKKKKKNEEKNTKAIRISERNLEKYLGKIKFPKEELNGKNEIGIVRGLAWTAVGGETLQIEVNIMPGKGDLELTGQLGDIMKESAVAGLSYVRSISKRYGVDDEFYQKNDIHIHIPEGAVPKDGPSAGISMATAVLSAVTKRRVRRDVAMTGEITLRGKVMPVGGLKEKILAAKMLGIKTVILPAENRREVEELDEEITGGLALVFVRKMEEVVKVAMEE